MDNDSIHKLAYRHIALFADLLRLVVPALAEELALDAAEEISAAHVSEDPDGFKQRFGDMTWRVPFKEGALKDGTHPYLLTLLEFQSTVDLTMPTRMREYGAMLHERLVADGTAEREGGLPWLLPIVLYNGNERWTAENPATALVPPPSETVPRMLAAYQPAGYVLFSLEQLLADGNGSLERLPAVNRAAATLRLQVEGNPDDIERCLKAEWQRFPGTGNAAIRRVLHTWATALAADLAGEIGRVPQLPSFEKFEGLTEGADMTTVSQARFIKWREELCAENIAKGLAQGIEQERGRSLAMLQRLVATKFGDGTAQRVASLMDTMPDQLEAAGIAIIECDDGEALLARLASIKPDDQP